MTTWRVVLDTDIGTDVDDLLALTMLLGAARVELVAVTTVYGDTVLRARLARRICELAGEPDVPVVPGLGEPLSGAPVWWAGHEGTDVPGLASTQLDASSEEVPNLLARLAAARRGQLDVLAIGPLTNIATAVLRHPTFARDLRHLWIMGGSFREGTLGLSRQREHNFASDALAASIVLQSRIPTTICGLDATLKTRLGPEVAEALEQRGELGQLIAAQLRGWSAFTGQLQGEPPHDAVAVLTKMTPALFEFTAADVAVIGDGPQAGVSAAISAAASPVRVVTGVNGVRASRVVLEALIHACLAGARRPVDRPGRSLRSTR